MLLTLRVNRQLSRWVYRWAAPELIEAQQNNREYHSEVEFVSSVDVRIDPLQLAPCRRSLAPCCTFY